MTIHQQSPVKVPGEEGVTFAVLETLADLETANDEAVSDIPEYPRSPRAYNVLLPILQSVIDSARARAKDYQENEIPFGGMVGFTDVMDNIQDIAIAPLQFSTSEVLNCDQFPIVITSKPPAFATPGEEFSFGRPIDCTDAADKKGGDELVLAIPAYNYITDNMYDFADDSRPVGSQFYDDLVFVSRDWAETDDRFLQLLPYIVFYKKIGGKIYVWVYQRSKYTAEGRLARGCSIAAGGHVNPEDFVATVIGKYSANSPHKIRTAVTGFWQGIVNCMEREVQEEITAYPDGPDTNNISTTELLFGQKPEDMTKEKYIHDKTVFFLDYSTGEHPGRFHLGMFTAFEVPADTVIDSNDRDLIAQGFIPIDEVAEAAPTPLEPWSRHIVESVRIATGQVPATKENHDLNGTISSIFGKAYRRYSDKINAFMKM